jgi:hypothetical protein
MFRNNKSRCSIFSRQKQLRKQINNFNIISDGAVSYINFLCNIVAASEPEPQRNEPILFPELEPEPHQNEYFLIANVSRNKGLELERY